MIRRLAAQARLHGCRVGAAAVVLLVFLVTEEVQAQVWRYPVQVDGLAGFIDEAGRMTVEPQFEELGAFIEGRSAARRDGLWGFVDADGQWRVEPIYRRVEPFSGGVARVLDDVGWALVDADGRRLTRRPYADLLPMNGGRAAFKTPAHAPEKGRWGLLDVTGAEVVPAVFDGALTFSQGLLPAQRYRKFLVFRIERRWGYADAGGAWVIDPRYTSARPFSDSLALVTNGRTGRFIRPDGSTAFDVPSQVVFPFRHGYARFAVDGRWGFIDGTGSPVVEPRYEAAGDFAEGLAAVRELGSWGYIDALGREVIRPRFDRVEPFSGPLARVALDGRVLYIDREGRTVWGD